MNECYPLYTIPDSPQILPMLVTIHNVLYQVTHLEIGTFLRAVPSLSPRLLAAKFAMPYLSNVIKERAQQLAEKVKEAVLQQNEDCDLNNDENEADADDSEEDSDELSASSISDENLEVEVRKRNDAARNLRPPSLIPMPTQTTAETNTASRRSPHCKVCQHSSKGHTRNEDGKSCQQCPQGKCSRTGRITDCSCDWHTAQLQINSAGCSATGTTTTSTSATSTSISQGLSLSHSTTTTQSLHLTLPQPTSLVTATTTFVIPLTISESNITGRNGSNACTIISALVAKMHLEGSLSQRIRNGQLSPVFIYTFPSRNY